MHIGKNDTNLATGYTRDKMSHVLNIYPHPSQRVFFVGDIHGNYALYERGLKTFGITDDDIVISCGDTMDRGEENIKTFLEFLSKPNRYMVLGNHEIMALNSTNPEWHKMWTKHGGSKVLTEIGEHGIDFFRPYMAQLPYLIVVHHRDYKVGVCHAEVPPYIQDFDTFVQEVEVNQMVRNDMIWDTTIMDSYKGKKPCPYDPVIQNIDYVFHGHVAVSTGTTIGNRVYIDSQFLAGELTFAHLDMKKQVQFQRRPRDFMSFVIPGSQK